MSFRNRLTLFFVLIVIVPMMSVGLVVFRLIQDNESGKADARVAEGQAAAIGLYRQELARSTTAIRRAGRDAGLTAATRGSAAQTRRRALGLMRTVGLRRLSIMVGGRRVVD